MGQGSGHTAAGCLWLKVCRQTAVKASAGPKLPPGALTGANLPGLLTCWQDPGISPTMGQKLLWVWCHRAAHNMGAGFLLSEQKSGRKCSQYGSQSFHNQISEGLSVLPATWCLPKRIIKSSLHLAGVGYSEAEFTGGHWTR